jgi:transposase-like protein
MQTAWNHPHGLKRMMSIAVITAIVRMFVSTVSLPAAKIRVRRFTSILVGGPLLLGTVWTGINLVEQAYYSGMFLSLRSAGGRYMRRSGRSWRVDETYLKVRGRWVYLYRGVDRDGNTVDFRLSPKRDVAAAKAFFRKALRTQGRAPVSITLDGYAASHRAVREMPTENKAWKQSKLRSSKYLNNLIEQDHRGIKFRTRPMLGFKNYDCAATTIAGIELLRRIGKNQFSLRPLRVKDQTAPTIWNAVLAA